MANSHAGEFLKQRDVRMAAACDVYAARVKEFAAKYKIPRVFTSVDELFAKGAFDAVTNVTPDRWCAPVSLKALSEGRHVLCEKPLAVCYSDAARMACAAEKAGVVPNQKKQFSSKSAITNLMKMRNKPTESEEFK